MLVKENVKNRFPKEPEYTIEGFVCIGRNIPLLFLRYLKQSFSGNRLFQGSITRPVESLNHYRIQIVEYCHARVQRNWKISDCKNSFQRTEEKTVPN